MHRQHKEKQSPLLRPSETNAKFISCDNFSLLAKLGSKDSPCKSSDPPMPVNKAEKAVKAVSERGFSKTGNLHERQEMKFRWIMEGKILMAAMSALCFIH